MSVTQTLATARPRSRGLAILTRVGGIVGGAVLTVAVASFVVFAGLSLAPGDPVSLILGPRASDDQRAALREQLGLDQPLPVRYFDWLINALQGDFGRSLIYKEDVGALVASRVPTTITLVIMTAVLIVVIGIGLGLVGGLSTRWRSIVSSLVGLGIAVPSFVAASLLIGVFAIALGWFPTFGSGDDFLDRLWHLTLPAIALSITSCAYVAQLTSAAVSEEADKDYVLTSRGRGVPFPQIVRQHVLPNAALPILTASGIAVAGLVAGTVIVEQAFALDGMGSLLVQSVSSKDYPVVLAIGMIVVVVFVVVMTLIDVAQIALDPRERAGS